MSVIIPDGAYEIISVYRYNNTPLALDVAGASDASRSDVNSFTRNHTDAQRWEITNFEDYGGCVQITAIMSGLCLDVPYASFDTDPRLWAHEDNNSIAQKFSLVADGKTQTIDGKEYPTYTICASVKTDHVVDIEGATNKPGTRTMLHEANGGDNQRWSFVPIDHFNKPGVYKILSAMSENIALDLECASTATGTNIQAYPNNDTIAQRWLVYPNNSNAVLGGIDGTICVLHPKAWKAMDENGGQNINRSNVWLYPINFTKAQCWFAERNGSMAVDKQLVPTYTLVVQASEGSNQLCLDAEGNVARHTNVFAHIRNDGPNQRWAFVPSSVPDDSLPVPASISTTTSIGNNAKSLDISFSCNKENFQARLRTKSRSANGQNYGEWSNWKSTADGLGGNEGWGNEWEPTLTLSLKSGDTKKASVTIPSDYYVDGSTIVSTQVQVEIRACEKRTHILSFSRNGQTYKDNIEYYVNGPSASQVFTLPWKPTPKLEKAVIDGDGILIYYSSDINDGGCVGEVSSSNSDTVTEKGIYGGEGMILIPASKIYTVPTEEIEYKFKLTKDVSSDVISKSMKTEDAANRVKSTIEYSESSYGTYIIKINGVNENNHDSVQVYAASETGLADVYNIEKESTYSKYECISPLKKKLAVYIWIRRSDGTWDVESDILDPITDHSYVWIFNGGACVLDLGTSLPGATQSDSMSRSNESYEIVGRSRKMYRGKTAIERNVSVSGIVTPSLPANGAWNDFDALLKAGHATFRNNRGEVMSVFVTEIERPDELYEYTKVTITQYEESL